MNGLSLVLAWAAVGPAWAFAGPALTGSGTGADLDRVLRRVEAAEAGLRDVSLSFSQRTTLKATADVQVTTGELAVLRHPERFKVTFLTPVSQVAAYDGAALTVYFPDAGQAFRQKASAEQLAQMLGVNPAAPVRSFRRGYAAALEGCDAAGCHLGFSRPPPSALTWHVTVSASTWLMSEAWFENAEVKVVLQCYDYLVNRRLAPATFRLKLPPSVDVQEGLPQLMGGAPGAEPAAAPSATRAAEAVPRPGQAGPP